MTIKDTDPIIKNTTCFAEHKKRNVTCQQRSCKNWMDSSDSLNCAVLGARRGKWILKDIGEIFGVTRMRICQIEKEILEKLSTIPIDPD
jgi:DNA-directed RNA polymerase sigma subunit (sigma70/sigma32)